MSSTDAVGAISGLTAYLMSFADELTCEHPGNLPTTDITNGLGTAWYQEENKIFAIGGKNTSNQGSKQFWELNLATLEWNRLDDLTTEKVLPHVFNVDNDTFLISGGVHRGYLSDSEEFNAKTKEFTPKRDLHFAGVGFCVTQNTRTGIIYLTGGVSGGRASELAFFFHYDSGLYVPMRPMQQSRVFHGCAIYEEEQKLVVAGGYGRNFQNSESTEVYDIGTNPKHS